MSGDRHPEESPTSYSLQEELEIAVRDLWSMIQESGEDYVVFMDRRRMLTRVQRDPNGMFTVLWEDDDQSWVRYREQFDNLRHAAFHAYQGPH